MGIIVDTCHQCGIQFKKNGNLTIRDGKAFHLNCAEKYIRKQKIENYLNEYPFLNENQIDNIISSNHNEELDKFNVHDWIILLDLNYQETTIFGFDTKDEVDQFIIEYYRDRMEPNSNINTIFYQKKEWTYSIDINVTLSPA
jgi:hypothetical protein